MTRGLINWYASKTDRNWNVSLPYLWRGDQLEPIVRTSNFHVSAIKKVAPIASSDTLSGDLKLRTMAPYFDSIAPLADWVRTSPIGTGPTTLTWQVNLGVKWRCFDNG